MNLPIGAGVIYCPKRCLVLESSFEDASIRKNSAASVTKGDEGFINVMTVWMNQKDYLGLFKMLILKSHYILLNVNFDH